MVQKIMAASCCPLQSGRRILREGSFIFGALKQGTSLVKIRTLILAGQNKSVPSYRPGFCEDTLTKSYLKNNSTNRTGILSTT